MEDLKAIIESLLFVTDKPLSVEKLAEIIEEADTKAIRAALQELLGEFNNPVRGFRLHEVAGGYQFRTHPECQAYIKRMLKPAPSRLSRAALETLAIIAYKQPIIRSDIEHIRGVDSGGVLRVLMEKKLVRVLGRREIPGRPLIYATTKRFLEVFDLKNLKDLPTPKEIEELTAQEPDLEAQPEVEAEQERPSPAAPSPPAADTTPPPEVRGETRPTTAPQETQALVEAEAERPSPAAPSPPAADTAPPPEVRGETRPTTAPQETQASENRAVPKTESPTEALAQAGPSERHEGGATDSLADGRTRAGEHEEAAPPPDGTVKDGD
jgi:segregation and condensation protein B